MILFFLTFFKKKKTIYFLSIPCYNNIIKSDNDIINEKTCYLIKTKLERSQYSWLIHLNGLLLSLHLH